MCGDEVVAGFADFGIRAGFGGEFTGAEAVRDTGFEQLGVEPFDSVGDQWFADRGDRQPWAHPSDRGFVGGAQRQDRLGAVQRLDLGFLVDTANDRAGRGDPVKPDHVAQLGLELDSDGLGDGTSGRGCRSVRRASR